MRRICASSSVSNQYFMATASGIPEDLTRITRLLPLPKPAFLVPAVLEALRSLERYRPITHLVPGEADPYCASDVRLNGGTLLTGDSDCLLYDLGPAGSVVFFQDVQASAAAAQASEGSRLTSAMTYSPAGICSRLGLEPGQAGMLAVAYEIHSNDRPSSLATQSRAQWRYLAASHASQYAEFVSQYISDQAALVAAPGYMSHLDARVSELVLNWADILGPASESTWSPVVYLPLLLDRWDGPSGWNPGTPVRQLAYSFCRRSRDEVTTATEYRRTLYAHSTGQTIELLDASEVPDALHVVLNYTSGFLDGPPGPTRLRWITASLGFEIGHAAAEGKESTALKLLQKAVAAGGKLDPGNWDTLHLNALIQGTLYSFRMLKQVLMSRIGHLLSSPSLEPQLREMEDRLASLPSLADFPSPADMADLFERLHHIGALKTLAEVSGISEPSLSGKAKTRSGESMKGKKLGREQAELARSSSNPFDALSVD